MKQKAVNSTEAHHEIEFFVEENPGTPGKQPAKPLPGHGGVEKRPVESIGVRSLTGIATVTLLIVTTQARAFGGPSLLALVTACAAGLLILSGYQRINRKLRVTSCILFAASLL